MLHNLPECLEEFTEHFVDGEASVSEAVSKQLVLASRHPELLPKVGSVNHHAFTHFPKDRNCEVCRRTMVKRALCRKRSGSNILRVGNFGDLITADHPVLNEECESRNSHRYAVIVQDLATQWLQAYPRKAKTSQ